MRRSRLRAGSLLAATLLGALLAPACVASLDDEFDGGPSATPADGGDDDAPPPVASGCAPLPGVVGDLRSIDLGEGHSLFVADDGAGFLVPQPVTPACPLAATPLGLLLQPPPTPAGALVAPLDLVQAGAGVALYYTLLVPDSSAPLGLRTLGIGLALRDGASGQLVPGGELLWSADRPAYGASAMRVGDLVYVHGCRSAGFLAEDCFVARAPAASLESVGAYEYFDGAAWSPDADDAAAVASGGNGVSVRPDAAHGGYLMTYVPPIGAELMARTAIAPEGPWSEAATLASCDLEGVGAGPFCSGAWQQPGVTAVPAGQLALSYSARSFAPDAGEATPRLVTLAAP